MSPRTRRDALRAAALAGAAVAAGCGGLPGLGGRELPPGTDRDGVTDRDALTRAHFAILRERSFRLDLRRGGATATARQADGGAGRRFLHARDVTRGHRDDHPVDVVETTDVWHGGSMDARAEARRRRKLVVPDDPIAFAADTGREPPIESVSYDRTIGNSALGVQDYNLGAVLGAVRFGSPERVERGGERRVRFPVVGPAEGAVDGSEAATAGGWLTARPDGLLRTVRVAIGPGVRFGGDHLSMDIGDLAGRSVRDRPAWVDRVPE